jgi:hypothetical protein
MPDDGWEKIYVLLMIGDVPLFAHFLWACRLEIVVENRKMGVMSPLSIDTGEGCRFLDFSLPAFPSCYE